jgi:drug/metabolite transporter (DMT)-like permease
MAHAAPVYGGSTRSPDLFGQRAHAIGRWAGTFALGLVYGYWAAANRRSGGPITTGNLVFGFVTAVVFTLLLAGVLTLGPRLRRESHALLWFAFFGVAFGFLYSQSGETVLLSVGLSLVVGIAVGLACFYWFYTHEDAVGHRVK